MTANNEEQELLIKLESNEPEGELSERWTNHKFNLNLVNPANKRKYTVIVVGTGLAGASAKGAEHAEEVRPGFRDAARVRDDDAGDAQARKRE